MIAMAIDSAFQGVVDGVCTNTNGVFKRCTIKGFVRMKNKCISQDDHYWEAYPRPSLNIDLNRNACTFDNPKDLLSFIDEMKKHPKISAHPVRIKNMFLFNEERAKQQFFYRTVMINWLYTPGITYGELAEQAKEVWEEYYNFQGVLGYGDKDPSESWATWRRQIEVAKVYLLSPEVKDEPVQFIVETQLLLRPYLIGRCKMHLLYKVCRADNPDALYSDFRATVNPEKRSFEEVQDDALQSVKLFMAETSDVNHQYENLKGATQLWKAAEQGHLMAVHELLQHPNIDPNKVRAGVSTTPLYIASYHGHVEVVKMIVRHPKVQVNLGKTDTAMTPLVAAAQEGREEVVKVLLQLIDIDVNQTTTEGVTPLCAACDKGRENIVAMLLTCSNLEINHALPEGSTAMSIAGSQGHAKIVEAIVARLQAEGSTLMDRFPARDPLASGPQRSNAVLAWAEDTSSSTISPSMKSNNTRLPSSV